MDSRYARRRYYHAFCRARCVRGAAVTNTVLVPSSVGAVPPAPARSCECLACVCPVPVPPGSCLSLWVPPALHGKLVS